MPLVGELRAVEMSEEAKNAVAVGIAQAYSASAVRRVSGWRGFCWTGRILESAGNAAPPRPRLTYEEISQQAGGV